jgi:hypothetical protein
MEFYRWFGILAKKIVKNRILQLTYFSMLFRFSLLDRQHPEYFRLPFIIFGRSGSESKQ